QPKIISNLLRLLTLHTYQPTSTLHPLDAFTSPPHLPAERFKKDLSLFLSPHPDDLVYSTFSALTDTSKSRSAIVFFNVSSFTRWRFLSRPAVTLLRKLEDRLLSNFMGVRVSYKNLPDYSITQKRTVYASKGLRPSPNSTL